MKAIFSEQYWYEKWDEMLVPAPGEDYINLEAKMDREVAPLDGLGITEAQMWKIRCEYAKPIAAEATALVRKELKTLKDIDSGRAQWGYTTALQEIHHDYEFRQRFEFNCIQLRDFKRKYNIAT